jgi:hypothetical protein
MKEINSLKSTVSTQKLNYDETFQQEKVRIKNEEEKKQKEIEDRLRTVTSSKEELEVNISRLFINDLIIVFLVSL